MNSSTFWIIALGFWVYTLQSKIKHLEEVIQGVLKKKGSSVPEDKKILKKEPYIVTKDLQSKEKKEVDDNSTEEISEKKSKDIGYSQYLEGTSDKKPMVSERIAVKHYEYVQESPSKDIEPSWFMQLLTNYFTGGNLLVRIGGVILFFGLAFLVKYVAAHTTISIEFRLMGVAIVAVGLIVLGWRLRAKEGAYGQILQGLGVAVLYLVIYGASKYYLLLSLGWAFLWMFVVVMLGSFLALKQSSLPLALFSTIGGFLVPILTSTGQGSHVVLFTYYFFLNLGIFFMAWKQAWRVLNIVGFLFTFVIATSWGVLRYTPEMFATTEPFLILYFLMYLAITVLFSRRSMNHLVDGTLLFGLPAVVFPLQTQLVSQLEYGAGYSAVVMGTLYWVLAKILKEKTPSKLLLQGFLGLGILFYTVAIPYFFDADITAAIWAMESSAVVWLALKQKRVLVRYFGELLLLVSIGLYLFSQLGNSMNFSIFLGYLIVVMATFFTAYQLEKNKEQLDADSYLSTLFLLLSFMVWMVSVWKVSLWIDAYSMMHKVLLGFLLGTVIFALLERFFKWALLVKLLQMTLPVGIVLFGLSLQKSTYPLNPFYGLGSFLFFALMGWHIIMLYRYDKQWKFANYLHIASLWFGVTILTLALRYWVLSHAVNHTIELLSVVIFPLLSIWIIMKSSFVKKIVPKYISLYRYIGAGGLLLFLILWEVIAFFFRADTIILPYVPVLNFLDLVQIAILYMMYSWIRHHKQETMGGLPLYFMTVTLIVVVFTRAVAHYGHYTYSFNTLWQMYYFQIGVVCLLGIVVWLSVKLFKHYRTTLFKTASFVLVIVLLLWEIRAFTYGADFIGNYFPLLNVLDAIQVGVLGMAGYWFYTFKNSFNKENKDIIFWILGLLTFILLSVVFGRAVHMYKEIPYHLGILWDNLYFQTGLSLLWSGVAIVLMLLSKRYAHRLLWLAGFGLLGLVVLKLFFVELANSGTIERIVSFMVVGTLLLLIGYFVPMPPSENKDLNVEKDEE